MLKHTALLFATFSMFQTAHAAQHIPISSCEDLKTMGADLSAHYYLTQDIECNGMSMEPTPGTFTGELTGKNENGPNYSIHWLNIRAAHGKPGGLFEKTNHAIIDNIDFNAVSVFSDDNTHRGLLAGDMVLTLVENVSAAKLSVGGETTADSFPEYAVDGREGGLAGVAYNSGVLNVHLSGVKIKQHTWAGGMFGEAVGTEINKSSVEGFFGEAGRKEPYPKDMMFGGLIGYASQVNIIESSAKGAIESPYNVGGLIGGAAGVEITNSYSQVDIYDTLEYAGGLIGRSYLEATFDHVFATGYVEAQKYGKGMIGSDSRHGDYISYVTEGYFDKETTHRENSGDSGSQARSTKRMTQEHDETFAVDKGWSRDIWVFVDGEYPVLK